MKHVCASALAAWFVSTMRRTFAASPRRIVHCGQSLLYEALPRDVDAIAASQGSPMRWHCRPPLGSPIRDRLSAGAPARPGAGFDTLIAAEQHMLIIDIVADDRARQLLWLHNDVSVTNPQGRMWFLASWLNVDDQARSAALDRLRMRSLAGLAVPGYAHQRHLHARHHRPATRRCLTRLAVERQPPRAVTLGPARARRANKRGRSRGPCKPSTGGGQRTRTVCDSICALRRNMNSKPDSLVAVSATVVALIGTPTRTPGGTLPKGSPNPS